MKALRYLAILLSLVAAPKAIAGEDPVYTGFFSNSAIGGYDAVAYFEGGKPIKGKKAFSVTYLGAEWRFASLAHKTAFEADPARYASQYGGYCAWAMSQGYTAKGDPEQWRIVDGRLYLNYDADIKAKWEQDIPGFIKKADATYPTLVDLED